MKSWAEINQEHARNASRILLGYEDAKQRLRNTTELAQELPYTLSDGERRRLLEEEKRQQARAAYESTKKAYAAEVERHHDAIAQRRAYLQERLFKIEDASAIQAAARASDEELETLMDRALFAGHDQLARALAMEASQRGAGDLMARFFDEVDGEARGLYGEWTELPSKEALDRQVENIDRIVQPPDYGRLIPYASATTT